MKYVLDASVGLKTVLPESDSALAMALIQDFQRQVHELIAPDTYLVECAHALTRAERRGIIQPPAGHSKFSLITGAAWDDENCPDFISSIIWILFLRVPDRRRGSRDKSHDSRLSLRESAHFRGAKGDYRGRSESPIPPTFHHPRCGP